MAVGFGGDGSGHFPFGQHLLDVRLHGVAPAGQVAAAGGDSIIGIHVRRVGHGRGFAAKVVADQLPRVTALRVDAE